MPAIEAQRRGGMSLRFRPLGKQIRVTIPTDQEEDVRRIKLQVERACTTGDFSTLDNVSRDIARSAFEKSGFSVPDGLAPDRFRPVQAPPGDLLLWDAVQLFLNYPTIKDDEQNRERHIYAFAHIVTFLGKKKPVKEIWVPEVRAFMEHRKRKNAANTTINREKASLSKLFTVLQELREVDENPCRLVKRFSTKSSERKVYIGHADATEIFRRLPDWLCPTGVFQANY